MTGFRIELEKKMEDAIYNYWGADNFDEERFGKFKNSVKEKFKDAIKKIIRYRSKQNGRVEMNGYIDRLEYIWNRLNNNSKPLLVDIIAYRLMGYKKIKLPLNSNVYWASLKKAKSLKTGNDTVDPHFLHFKLDRFNLRPIGYDLELYFFCGGVAIDFIIEQYAHKINNTYIIQAEKGDVVLDIGACWGDTALYFADKVGDNGKVFSFEFIPENINIYNRNMELNAHYNSRIQLIQNPVADVSGQKVYYQDFGPGSTISATPFKNQTGNTTTISVDDFADRYNILKVDFIKMDIEGAEPAALRGAINTIKKYRPKLAIAIYHSMEDFVNIPKWLMDLNLGYEFFLGHHTIHAEETIIYASATGKWAIIKIYFKKYLSLIIMAVFVKYE